MDLSAQLSALAEQHRFHHIQIGSRFSRIQTEATYLLADTVPFQAFLHPRRGITC